MRSLEELDVFGVG
jgi:hypothetical protein